MPGCSRCDHCRVRSLPGLWCAGGFFSSPPWSWAQCWSRFTRIRRARGRPARRRTIRAPAMRSCGRQVQRARFSVPARRPVMQPRLIMRWHPFRASRAEYGKARLVRWPTLIRPMKAAGKRPTFRKPRSRPSGRSRKPRPRRGDRSNGSGIHSQVLLISACLMAGAAADITAWTMTRVVSIGARPFLLATTGLALLLLKYGTRSPPCG